MGRGTDKKKTEAMKLITIDQLRPHFDKPIKQVAAKFDVCVTLFKKVCRQNGIRRWPARRIRSIEKRLDSIKLVLTVATDGQRRKYLKLKQTLEQDLAAVYENPNAQSSTSDMTISATDLSEVRAFIDDAQAERDVYEEWKDRLAVERVQQTYHAKDLMNFTSTLKSVVTQSGEQMFTI